MTAAAVPIVCLHGLGRSPADWEPTRAALGGLGRVVTPALPPRPADALELLDRTIEPGAIVIGHSMGAVVMMRLLAREPRRLTAAVLTGCFFPPARNGRSLAASIRDYGSHRVEFLRASRRERARGTGREAIAPLALLALQAVRPGGIEPALDRAAEDVLVVHARDDHHVPVDFAITAARRNPSWTLSLLDAGGHHAHVRAATSWSGIVVPWLSDRLQR